MDSPSSRLRCSSLYLGRLYAVLNDLSSLSEEEIRSALSDPAQGFLALKQQRIEQAQRVKSHFNLLGKLLSEVDLEASDYDLREFLIGFLVQTNELPSKKSGRPRTGKGVDWQKIDMTRRTGQIAREHDVSPAAVSFQKKKLRQEGLLKGTL